MGEKKDKKEKEQKQLNSGDYLATLNVDDDLNEAEMELTNKYQSY